jgi:glycosyltransferase involved in cell wall biosynthesis
VKVLALTRYGRTGASSRMRFHQYLPSLEAAGIQVDLAPLFSDDYVRGLQQGRRNPWEVLRAYAGRVGALRRAGGFDLLWIEKEVLPWLPAGLEMALMSGRIPFVLDYDDAVFHGYDQHRSALLRQLLVGKHPALMRRAALVVAGNDYLADFARAAGSVRVEVVPTVIDLTRYLPPEWGGARAGALPTVGWIGQRATASFLAPLAPVFERLSAEGQARFAAIGVDTAALGLPMRSVPWSEATEVASISQFDVGIMPLVDEPFERGKCGYKLIQYMACGLPVVASPVGVNRKIVEHGVNGFLAESPEQWAMALKTLAADAGLRERMGQVGRRKVEQEFCLQVTAPRMTALLQAATRT